MNSLKSSLLLIAASMLFSFCKKDEDSGTPLDNAGIVAKYLTLDLNSLPNYSNPALAKHYDANILAQVNSPSLNRVTNSGAALGRVLFYDKNLSRNNKVACASCHLQEKGFSDDLVKSQGFEGGLTGAHSMRLANANFYTGKTMFWNKRAADLEEQTTMPVKDHTEMGFDTAHGGIGALIARLNQLEYYPPLFETAFGSKEINETKIKMALAQFVRSMVSTGSRFDQGFAAVFNTAMPGAGVGLPFQNFTDQENRGKMLFTAPPPQGVGCAGCHSVPTFALAPNSLSNGLDATETVIFKAPSLKNVGVTGPYMHDGRFKTLEEVVEHYNSGVKNAPSLDNRLRFPPGTPNAGQPVRLNLSDADKAALVAFMKTLTDDNLLKDTKFATPFK